MQNRFALSEKGAKTLLVGIVCTIVLNLAILMPAMYAFYFLYDFLQTTQHHSLMQYVTIALICLAVLFIIAMLQYHWSYTKVYEESAARRINLAEKLRRLPLAFFGEKNLSDLTSTLMEDNTTLESTFSHTIPTLMASMVSIPLVATGLFIFNWRLALALFWVAPLSLIIVMLARRKMKRSFDRNYQIKRDLSEQIQEGIEAIQEIKSNNGEERYAQDLEQKLSRYEKSLIKMELLGGAFVNTANVMLKLGLATVIITGAYLLSAGKTDIFTYIIFLVFGSAIYNPISDVFNNITLLLFLDVRIDRMRQLENMPAQHGKTEFDVKSYDITFQNVKFSYQEGKQVLKDVSFTARQGEVTALVGPSGEGKSTSAKLAARFWDIDGGKILLGGEDISQIDPEALLRHYAIVFQDVVLFNASVADNIRIGNPQASDKEIRRVAELAQCEDFIKRLPNGYNTIIGENGETLSGGERQRISIARALLKDAPIILLDEATASLDVENETKIQAGISALIKNKTVLIIAHRMRTVSSAHKIVVLKGGEVLEMGTPAKLIASGGEFARMLKTQKG